MQKRLIIGLVLPAVPSYSETFFRSKIQGLVDQGYLVHLFVNKFDIDKDSAISIPIYPQPQKKEVFTIILKLTMLFIFNISRVIRYIRLEKKSNMNWSLVIKHLIINSHILNKKLDWLHFGFATMGIQRENVAQAIGAKSAVSLRGFDIGLYSHQHPGCYNLLWKKIDKIHTISDDLYYKAIELGLDQKVSCEKITPAINTDFFSSELDRDLHDPLRVLTVGRLDWKKGYEYALQALSLLKEKQCNFEYHIIGTGNYCEPIKFAIHQLGLTENIILKGLLPHEDVKSEMEWADIYIQPSIQEGFCNAVLEAQAMGLLCIVSNAEGLSENIIHGKTGWVVPKRSPEAIAEQTLNILNKNRNQCNDIRKNAIYRIKEHFQLDDQIMNWSKFYQND